MRVLPQYGEPITLRRERPDELLCRLVGPFSGPAQAAVIVQIEVLFGLVVRWLEQRRVPPERVGIQAQRFVVCPSQLQGVYHAY